MTSLRTTIRFMTTQLMQVLQYRLKHAIEHSIKEPVLTLHISSA